MADADPELPANQATIIAACAPQPFTTFNWPPNHVLENDSAAKKEVDHCIAHYWAQHARQLSRYLTKLKANLGVNTERMRASPATWQPI